MNSLLNKAAKVPVKDLNDEDSMIFDDDDDSQQLFNDSDDDDSEQSEYETKKRPSSAIITTDGQQSQPKKKRQRLTHLTPEEKLQRRKIKNRVAAQSARDRKKVKMDELEETVRVLKEQNERLAAENSLLRKQTQKLIDQQRKLIGSIKEQQQQQPSQTTPSPPKVPQVVQMSQNPKPCSNNNNNNNCNVVSITRRRPLANVMPLEAEESAVFSIHVAQPQRQLQVMFQKLIYALVIYSMQLHKEQQQKTCTEDKRRLLRARSIKVKLLIQKLVQRFRHQHHHQHQPQPLNIKPRVLNIVLQSSQQHKLHHNQQQQANLILLLALATKFKRSKK